MDSYKLFVLNGGKSFNSFDIFITLPTRKKKQQPLCRSFSHSVRHIHGATGHALGDLGDGFRSVGSSESHFYLEDVASLQRFVASFGWITWHSVCM